MKERKPGDENIPEIPNRSNPDKQYPDSDPHPDTVPKKDNPVNPKEDR